MLLSPKGHEQKATDIRNRLLNVVSDANLNAARSLCAHQKAALRNRAAPYIEKLNSALNYRKK